MEVSSPLFCSLRLDFLIPLLGDKPHAFSFLSHILLVACRTENKAIFMSFDERLISAVVESERRNFMLSEQRESSLKCLELVGMNLQNLCTVITYVFCVF